MFLADITPSEISNIFESLKTKFSLDTYGLNPYYLKKICPVLLPVLTKLFQKCLDRQVFPDSFKVKPLFKEGNDLDPSNYRPFSLLPVVGKIFERVIYNRMNQYLTKYLILQNCQFGFRSKRSTIDALITLIEEVSQDWDSNNTKTQCTFIDLKKAFDTVDHTLLLEKCDAYGFRGPVFDLLKSYLKNRQQHVATKTKRSQNKNVNYGVPQGSILGPLLFIIYINYIELNENSESNLILYADDTVIKTTAKNSDLTGKHQEALDKTASWLEKNKLTLNEDKTKTMILSKKRSDKSDVKMNGIVIEEKQSFRYLGVQIDSKLSFIDHITKIENKLSMFCGMFYRLRKVLGKDQLLKAYNAYVKPILQYGGLAYASTDQTKLETIELEIKRLLKIIFFKRRNESIEELRQKRKIYFVKELHIYELLKLLCKVLRKECISTIVQKAVTEKNLNTILNKRVLARQIPVQSKGNQKNFCKR